MSSDRYFIERREQGDYAVKKPKAKRASVVMPTQKQAIDWARKHGHGHEPVVERVKHEPGGKNPGQWRKAR